MKVSLLFGAALLGVTALVAAARGQGDRPAQQPESQPAEAQPGTQEKTVYVLMKTSMGDITLELNREKAPISTDNFLAYTDKKFYDGTVFHRVIKGFMIQGGDPLGTGYGGPGYRFKDEIHPSLRFDRPYLLAMANSGQPNTNGSQFFITVAPTPHLNYRHTIFGQVADEASARVVDAIANTPTDPWDRPLTDVVIERVEIERTEV